MTITVQEAQKLRGHRKYQRMRRRFLRASPLCAECERRGIIRPAEELDHIIPIFRDPSLVMDPDNLQGLCRVCHADKTSADTGANRERRNWLERVQRLAGG